MCVCVFDIDSCWALAWICHLVPTAEGWVRVCLKWRNNFFNCCYRGYSSSCLHYFGVVFPEDQILLSDCASSLAVQVTFCSVCVFSTNISEHMCIIFCRDFCFCMGKKHQETRIDTLIDPFMFFVCTGLPQDVRSTSAGGLQSKCWIHVPLWLVHMLLQRWIYSRHAVIVSMQSLWYYLCYWKVDNINFVSSSSEQSGHFQIQYHVSTYNQKLKQILYFFFGGVLFGSLLAVISKSLYCSWLKHGRLLSLFFLLLEVQ